MKAGRRALVYARADTGQHTVYILGRGPRRIGGEVRVREEGKAASGRGGEAKCKNVPLFRNVPRVKPVTTPLSLYV